jgi:hypothetical protein
MNKWLDEIAPRIANSYQGKDWLTKNRVRHIADNDLRWGIPIGLKI